MARDWIWIATEVAEAARRDPLTGLFNVRAFHRALAKNRQLAGGGADHDIASHQLGRNIRQQHGVGAKLFGLY